MHKNPGRHLGAMFSLSCVIEHCGCMHVMGAVHIFEFSFYYLRKVATWSTDVFNTNFITRKAILEIYFQGFFFIVHY